jgi:GT2 family glycosyltransferase
MVKKVLFEKVGGFDEKFTMAAQEDKDLKNQLFKHTNIVFVPDTLVVHPVRIAHFGIKMKRVPASWQNWIIYVRKQSSQEQKHLIQRSIKMHLHMIGRSLTRFHFRKMIYHCWAGLQYVKLL